MSVAVLLPFLLSLLLLRPAPSSCEYGGHDLFTSLAQLGELWRDEREVVREMRRAAETLGEMREVLERYVANHQALGLDGEPSFQYLGHPLNSYHLVRHVALGWQEVRESVFRAENETREIFGTKTLKRSIFGHKIAQLIHSQINYLSFPKNYRPHFSLHKCTFYTFVVNRPSPLPRGSSPAERV